MQRTTKIKFIFALGLFLAIAVGGATHASAACPSSFGNLNPQNFSGFNQIGSRFNPQNFGQQFSRFNNGGSRFNDPCPCPHIPGTPCPCANTNDLNGLFSDSPCSQNGGSPCGGSPCGNSQNLGSPDFGSQSPCGSQPCNGGY